MIVKLEWFTLAEAAAIWGVKDGVAGLIRLILEGDDQRLSASYILPTPWKAYYIKRIEEPSSDTQKWFSPETKEVWRVDIEVTGLINLSFSGACRNSDGSITIRGDGSVGNHWPSQTYINIPDSNLTSSLHLISTGETPLELQDCLNVLPEQDLVVTREQLEFFARTVGRSSVLTKLNSLPASSNVATCEILIKFESRIDIEHNPRQAHDFFDTTESKKKYCVPKGCDPVRLTSTSGYTTIIDEEPRCILAGFEQEAIEKGGVEVVEYEPPVEKTIDAITSPKPPRKTPNTKDRRSATSTFMDDALYEYWTKHKKYPNTVDILMEGVTSGTANRKGDEKYEVINVMTSPENYLTLKTKKGQEPFTFDQVKKSFEYRLSVRLYRTMTPRAKLPT